jgi:AraC-like DNA-binding protein
VQAATFGEVATQDRRRPLRFGPFIFVRHWTDGLLRDPKGVLLVDGDFWMIRVREKAEGAPNPETTPEVTPVRLEFEPGGEGSAAPCMVLIFPVSAIGVRAAEHAAMPSAAGAALSDHLRLLDRLLPAADDADRRFLAEATGALLAACLSPRPSERLACDDLRRTERRADVERCIRRNIDSARLDAARICALTGVSRSTLYRLFSESGGVAGHVRRLRLEMVFADLADPVHEHENIAEIAARRGLYCASSFTRSFRKAFGFAPSDVRARVSSRGTDLCVGGPPEAAAASTGSVPYRSRKAEARRKCRGRRAEDREG